MPYKLKEDGTLDRSPAQRLIDEDEADSLALCDVQENGVARLIYCDNICQSLPRVKREPLPKWDGRVNSELARFPLA